MASSTSSSWHPARQANQTLPSGFVPKSRLGFTSPRLRPWPGTGQLALNPLFVGLTFRSFSLKSSRALTIYPPGFRGFLVESDQITSNGGRCPRRFPTPHLERLAFHYDHASSLPLDLPVFNAHWMIRRITSSVLPSESTIR